MNTGIVDRMDFFSVGSTVLVFSALVVVVFTAYLVVSGRESTVQRFDLIARSAIPAGFLGLLGWFLAG